MDKTLTLGSLVVGDEEARIAVPLVAASRDELESQWSLAAAAGADLIEWRLDASGTPDWECAQELRGRFDIPVLATVRTAAEGGGFAGNADEYAALVREAARWAEAVDIEQDIAGAADLLVEVQSLGAAVVLSHHVFDRPVSPEEIRERLVQMAGVGANIAKIAWMVSDEAEAEVIRKAQAWAAENLPVPAVVIGMGAAGTITRLGESARLSAFTFAVGSRASAPGQLSIDQVRTSLA